VHSSCTSRSKSGWVPSPDSCQTRSAPHLGNAVGAAQGSRAVQRGGGQQARHLGAPDLRYRDRQADPPRRRDRAAGRPVGRGPGNPAAAGTGDGRPAGRASPGLRGDHATRAASGDSRRRPAAADRRRRVGGGRPAAACGRPGRPLWCEPVNRHQGYAGAGGRGPGPHRSAAGDLPGWREQLSQLAVFARFLPRWW
jgi:hypothetical protein